jgi:hypothetical protein
MEFILGGEIPQVMREDEVLGSWFGMPSEGDTIPSAGNRPMWTGLSDISFSTTKGILWRWGLRKSPYSRPPWPGNGTPR